MKRDKAAGVAFGGPEQIEPVQVSTIPVSSTPVAPQITLPASAQVTPE
jgi:hypothetical protein